VLQSRFYLVIVTIGYAESWGCWGCCECMNLRHHELRYRTSKDGKRIGPRSVETLCGCFTDGDPGVLLWVDVGSFVVVVLRGRG
jgi:hypothetical protein